MRPDLAPYKEENKEVLRGRAESKLLALIAAVLLAACATAPPVQEMSNARQAITAAEQANAQGYAPQALDEARRFLAEAEEQIRQQAYGPARMSAVRAKNRAQQALKESERAVAKAQKQ